MRSNMNRIARSTLSHALLQVTKRDKNEFSLSFWMKQIYVFD